MGKLLIGTDPEVFVKNKNIISAVGMVGGTKEFPKEISEEGHALQEDNVLVEFNTPPRSNPSDLYNDIQFCLAQINNILPKGVNIEIVSSAYLDDIELASEQAQQFGCEPDFNVWTKDLNIPPNPDTNLRTAGGHVHVGYENPSQEKSEQLIRAMDLFLGVPSVLMDSDKLRRSLYGSAGSFRFKDYGVEYRTLSNFWIKNKQLVEFIFEQTQRAFDFEGDLIPHREDIEIAINKSDKDLAKSLIEKFNVLKTKTTCVEYLDTLAKASPVLTK